MIPSLSALAPYHHETSGLKNVKVFHNRKSCGGELICKFACGARAFPQEVENLAPRRVRQRGPNGGKLRMIFFLYRTGLSTSHVTLESHILPEAVN